MSRILTGNEVIAKLSITRTTFYELIKRGVIPARKIGKEWRVQEKALNRLFEEDGMGVVGGAEKAEARAA